MSPSTVSAFDGDHFVEVAVKKLFLLAAAALTMAACSESSTGPSTARKFAPDRGASSDITCRSGYIVAYDEFGNPYCAPDGFARTTPPRKP
jgi:hypothetical protein